MRAGKLAAMVEEASRHTFTRREAALRATMRHIGLEGSPADAGKEALKRIEQRYHTDTGASEVALDGVVVWRGTWARRGTTMYFEEDVAKWMGLGWMAEVTW